MRRWLLWTLALAAVAAAVVVLRATLFAPAPIEVRVARAERGRVESTVTNSRAGTVRARQRAHLAPEVGGRAVEIPHRKGDSVQKGDVLLRLDDQSQRGQLELARRDLEAARAREREVCLGAEQAARELRRYTSLSAREIVPPDRIDQLESVGATTSAGCAAARAGVARARAGVGVAETEHGKTVLRAPFDGVIAELAIEIGEWTAPSPPALPIPPVIDLINRASIDVTAPMDEVDSARIRPELRARVTLDPFPRQSFPGEVTRVAPFVLDVQAQSRTVEIEVELDDATFSRSLLPGTSADVEVILELRDGVLRIPTSAVLEGESVLVVEQSHLVRRGIDIGLRNWDWTEVRRGLAEGEAVVLSLDRPGTVAGARAVIEAASPTPSPAPAP